MPGAVFAQFIMTSDGFPVEDLGNLERKVKKGPQKIDFNLLDGNWTRVSYLKIIISCPYVGAGQDENGTPCGPYPGNALGYCFPGKSSRAASGGAST